MLKLGTLGQRHHQKMTAPLLFLFSLLCLNGACLAAAESGAALDKVPWILVNARANVKFGDKAWKGATDLAFKYRLRVDRGTLFVEVAVTDDKVLLKNTDTVVSDHVELWLADGALVDQMNADLASVMDYDPASVVEDVAPGEMEEVTGCDDFKQLLAEIKTTAETLKKDKHHVQLIFNKGTLLALPGDRFSATAARVFDIRSEYKPAPGGYTFTAAVPLAGLLDTRTDSLADLAWLIDVSDIDSEKAAKQESLMSSSAARRFDDPTSFARLAVTPALQLPLTPYLRMLGALESYGYYRADKSAPQGYRYLAGRDLFVFDCHYWILDELPGGYAPLEGAPLTPLGGYGNPEAQIYAYGPRVAVLTPDAFGVADLADTLSGTGAFEYKLLHRYDLATENASGGYTGSFLLFTVTGASRYPMSNGMCGAGFETDAVLVTMGADLEPGPVKTRLVESCFQNVIMDEVTLRASDGADTDADVQITYEAFEYDSQTDTGTTTTNRVLYSAAEPEPRWEVQTLKVEKDSN